MKPNNKEHIRNTKVAKVAEFSAFSFVSNLKSLLKTLFGRHYEPWIRRPLIPLRTLKRQVVCAVKHSHGIKSFIKNIFGRYYEPWIRRPYVWLRRVKQRISFALRQFSQWVFEIPRYCRQLPGTLKRFSVHNFAGNWKGFIKSQLERLYEPLKRLLIASPRLLQLRAQVYCNKQPWHPLRVLVNPVLESAVNILEYRYRRYFHRFGTAVAASPRSTTDRRGILVVSGTLGPGGSERQTVLTVLGLARRGLQSVRLAVVYLRTEFERFYQHKLEAAGMKVIEFNRDDLRNDVGNLQGLLRAVKILPVELHDVANYTRALAEQRPEIVHLWLDEVNVKGGLAAVAAGVPRIILSSRNLPPNNFLLYQSYMREGYRWLLRQPGVRLINNSVAGARAYERWLGLPKGSIRVVHNGFDFDERLLAACRDGRAEYRERHGIPLKAPLVGTVIRLSEEKRPLLWAEIAARIGRVIPEAHFLVVGDGPLRAELEARAARPDLAGRLHVIGLEKQALTAMAAMDLFLLSSRGEGLPNVLVEAQALGVPVVTTRAGGAPETLDHGRTGWVLENDSPTGAAAVIVRLLGDKQWLERAGKAAPDFVKRRFGMDRMLDETLKIYDNQKQQAMLDEKELFIQRG